MKKRLLSVLVFALVVSTGAAFVLYQLIATRVKAEVPKPQPVTVVFVAARDLELGALILEKDLRTQQYLTPPPGTIAKKEDIIGRGVINPIHEDQPFFELALAPKGAGAGFASTIPKGMRAFAIHVNDVVGVAGFAVAGMRVDVLVSGTPSGSSTAGSGQVARTLLQNVQVLSAGQNYQKDAQGRPVLVQVVNLLVTPSQAEIMNLAADQRIQLVLRNPSDQEVVQTPGASQQNVFTAGAVRQTSAPRVAAGEPARPVASIAPPPPAKPRSVVIEQFAGEQKSQTVFQNPGPEPPK